MSEAEAKKRTPFGVADDERGAGHAVIARPSSAARLRLFICLPVSSRQSLRCGASASTKIVCAPSRRDFLINDRISELRCHVGGRWRAFDPIHVPRPIYGDKSHCTCLGPRFMHSPRRHVVEAARAELRLFSITLNDGCAGNDRVGLICRMPVLSNMKGLWRTYQQLGCVRFSVLVQNRNFR